MLLPWLLGTAALAAVALTVLRRRLAVLRVLGPSMEPALRHGQRTLFLRSRRTRLRTGRIVVVSPPPGLPAGPGRPPSASALFVKRVAALPGEPIPAEVCAAAGAAPGDPVPPGQVVLLGDNPAFSTDSRLWGPLPVSSVVGVVLGGARPRN